MKNKIFVSLAILASLILAVPALAQSDNSSSKSKEFRGDKDGLVNWGKMMQSLKNAVRPNIVVGTVTSINGSTLTVTSNSKVGLAWGKDDDEDDDTPKATPAPIVYTVNASNASVFKGGTASNVANIAVGDKVKVQGTITGTNIVAVAIRDEVKKDDDEKQENKKQKPESTPLIQGNGQPIIMGIVSAVNGTTLTVTNRSNIAYTVDASTAKIQKRSSLSTLSEVVVGDNVIVQGTINGTAITAYSVIDQGTKPSPSVKPNDKEKARSNFFGGIGRFLQHLFGF